MYRRRTLGVCGHTLKKSRHCTVLVGGAVVSIYTEGIYKSGDLDFVLTNIFQKGLEEAMEKIGFIRSDSRHYKHPECKHLFIEFPSSFLEIGNDSKIEPVEVSKGENIIKILSPTDCVKDRLASYIYFKARECFDQAVLVAKKHPVNLKEIKKWCKGESSPEVYQELVELIKK